jgi:hemerythrin superfamily protein
VDALELLKSDHDTVRGLFEQFEQAKESGDTQQLKALQEQIFTELEVHTSVEEEVFYPEAKAVGEEAEELVAEGVEEHHVVKILMEEIQALTPEDEAWAAKMSVLIENVEHHAEEEETELFPQLRETFGDERLQRMGQQLEEAKQRRGAPPTPQPDIVDLTRDELYEKAQDLQIEGRSEMTKEELIQAIRSAT